MTFYFVNKQTNNCLACAHMLLASSSMVCLQGQAEGENEPVPAQQLAKLVWTLLFHPDKFWSEFPLPSSWSVLLIRNCHPNPVKLLCQGQGLSLQQTICCWHALDHHILGGILSNSPSSCLKCITKDLANLTALFHISKLFWCLALM